MLGSRRFLGASCTPKKLFIDPHLRQAEIQSNSFAAQARWSSTYVKRSAAKLPSLRTLYTQERLGS